MTETRQRAAVFLDSETSKVAMEVSQVRTVNESFEESVQQSAKTLLRKINGDIGL